MFERKTQTLYDMLSFQAAPFLEISKDIGGLRTMLDVNRKAQNPSWNEDSPFLVGPIDGIDICSKIKSECEKIHLHFSTQKAEWILKNLKAGKLTFRGFMQALEELESRVRDELDGQPIYRLTLEEQKRYDEIQPFGEEVQDKFPGIQYDLEEASKCLAFERSTAAVMHLQRAMEAILKEFGKPLNLDPDNCMGWGDFLRKLTDGLNEKFGTKGEKWRDRAPFYSDTIPFLYSVKIAWRDPSMHVRGQYDTKKAMEIFEALRGFARNVAEGMPITL